MRQIPCRNPQNCSNQVSSPLCLSLVASLPRPHLLSLRHKKELSRLSPSWSSFLDLMLQTTQGQPHNRPWFIDLLIEGLTEPAFLSHFPDFCEQGLRAVCRFAYSQILLAKTQRRVCMFFAGQLKLLYAAYAENRSSKFFTDLPFRSCGAQRSLDQRGGICRAARWLSSICAACVRGHCSLGAVGTLHCNNDGFPCFR